MCAQCFCKALSTHYRHTKSLLPVCNSVVLKKSNFLCSTYSVMKRKMSSALFVSDASPLYSSRVQVDLNIVELMSDKDKLKQNLAQRNMIFDVELWEDNWKIMKKLKSEKLKLEDERKQISEMMNAIRKSKKTSDEIEKSKEMLLRRGREVKTSLKSLLNDWWDIEEKVMLQALKYPNSVHPDTPLGGDKVIDESIHPKDIDVSGLSHVQIARKYDLISFEHIGPRSYFLKEDLVKLEFSLINYLSDQLEKAGFTPIICPEIYRTLVVEGVGLPFEDPKKIFTLEHSKDDYDKFADFSHFLGVSPCSFVAYLTKMNIDQDILPLKYYTSGRNYTPDIQKLPGLLGALQSVQIHSCSVTRSETEALEAFYDIQNQLWDLYKVFKLPIRLVMLSGEKLTTAEMLTAEIQIWLPVYKDYVKVAAVSLVGDYISRRLMVKYSENKNKVIKENHVNMVFSEVFCSKTLLSCLLEYADCQETVRFRNLSFLDDYEL